MMARSLNIVHRGIWAREGYAVCVQPNGERIPVERWILDRYVWGRGYNDPEVNRYIERAVRVEIP